LPRTGVAGHPHMPHPGPGGMLRGRPGATSRRSGPRGRPRGAPSRPGTSTRSSSSGRSSPG
ncbi:MAG: hypothetical protein ACK55I_19905, partial [bacterium]